MANFSETTGSLSNNTASIESTQVTRITTRVNTFMAYNGF